MITLGQYQEHCDKNHRVEKEQMLDNKQAAVLLGLSATVIESGHALNILKKHLYKYKNRIGIDDLDLQRASKDVSPMHISQKDAATLHAVLGLQGEVSHLLKLILVAIRSGEEMPKDSLEDEIGDCLYYLSRLASSCGIDMDLAALRNAKKTDSLQMT
jgi:NTP pyrophosphatase (non-canonical NTP hydrolase)